MCAPQNAGSGLNGAVGFGPKTKSDGQCANDRSISKTKASLPVTRDDPLRQLATNPITNLVTEIKPLVQAGITI